MHNFPEIIHFLVTSKCNRDCEYCFDPKAVPELNLAKIKQIFQLFAQRGVKGVLVSGGEPFLRHDIVDIFQELKRYNFKIYLDTNGDLFAKHKTTINNYIDVLGLPFDQPVESSSNQVLKILQYYKSSQLKKRPKIRLGTVVTQQNIHQLDKLGKMLSNYPVDIWKIYQFTPYGSRAEQNQAQLLVDTQEFLKQTHIIRSQYSCYFEVLISPRTHRHSAYFMVDPDGTVSIPFDNRTRCQRNLIGNVFDHNIVTKWQTLVYEKNYLNNAETTLFYEWQNYPMRPIYNQIYQLAKPYYYNAQFYTKAHIDWLIREALVICKQEKVDERILIPLIILHDIGYAKIPKGNPYTFSSRTGHMQAGGILAEEILTRVNYPEKLKQRIAYYVSIHDVWSLGNHQIYNQDKTFGVYEDLDYLSMLSDRHFSAISQMLHKTPEHTLDFITTHEKLTNRPFHSQSTKRLFEEYLENKQREIQNG